MKDIAIDTNGNFIRKNFGISITETPLDYIMQKIGIKLRVFLGEYYLDTTIGIPLFQVLEKNPNLTFISAIMKEKILSVEGVTSITSFTLSQDKTKRKLIVTFSIQTIYGPTGGTIA